MSKLIQRKRVLICTFVALSSACLSAYIGAQVSWQAHKLNCQTQFWGWKTACQAWVAPGALWQGSTTGLWTGGILGALLGGLATRPSGNENEGDRRG